MLGNNIKRIVANRWMGPGQLAALAVVAASTTQMGAALAANCAAVEQRYERVVSVVPPDGAIAVVKYCLVACDDAPFPELALLPQGDAGAPIAGTVEVLPMGASSQLAVFHPDVELAPGAYKVVPVVDGQLQASPSTDYWYTEVEVAEDASLPVLPEELPTMDLLEAWFPYGEKACCPVTGEGDCTPFCVGAEGEQLLAAVAPAEFFTVPGFAWRIAPTSPDDGQATDWMLRFGGLQDDALFTPRQARFEVASDEYCVELEVRNLIDGSVQTFPSCVAGDASATIGEVRADYIETARLREPSDVFEGVESLAECSAPPILGIWGLDLAGVPDEASYPTPPEHLTEAWCAAASECQDPPEFKNCDHYAHFCGSGAGAPPGEVDAGGVEPAPAVLDGGGPVEVSRGDAALPEPVEAPNSPVREQETVPEKDASASAEAEPNTPSPQRDGGAKVTTESERNDDASGSSCRMGRGASGHGAGGLAFVLAGLLLRWRSSGARRSAASGCCSRTA